MKESQSALGLSVRILLTCKLLWWGVISVSVSIVSWQLLRNSEALCNLYSVLLQVSLLHTNVMLSEYFSVIAVSLTALCGYPARWSSDLYIETADQSGFANATVVRGDCFQNCSSSNKIFPFEQQNFHYDTFLCFFFSLKEQRNTERVDLRHARSNSCTHVASARIQSIKIMAMEDVRMPVHDLVSKEVRSKIELLYKNKV